jgi:hypothetical protein
MKRLEPQETKNETHYDNFKKGKKMLRLTAGSGLLY